MNAEGQELPFKTYAQNKLLLFFFLNHDKVKLEDTVRHEKWRKSNCQVTKLHTLITLWWNRCVVVSYSVHHIVRPYMDIIKKYIIIEVKKTHCCSDTSKRTLVPRTRINYIWTIKQNINICPLNNADDL